MTDVAKLKHHADLLDRMASAVGVDLEQATAAVGGLTLDDLADAVLRCAGCPDPDHCATWLAARTEPVADTPGYCRNRELLARLGEG